MAGHDNQYSLRQAPNRMIKFSEHNPMRPGKTAEDKRIGAWKPKHVRNQRQAEYRAKADADRIGRKAK